MPPGSSPPRPRAAFRPPGRLERTDKPRLEQQMGYSGRWTERCRHPGLGLPIHGNYSGNESGPSGNKIKLARKIGIKNIIRAKPPKVERPRGAVVQDRPTDKETAKQPRAKRTPEQHREYEQARNKTPERMEYNRRLAQEQRQKAKELGRCRDCSSSAIPGQVRCPTCAEAHRQSRRRSDARRRATAKGESTAME